MKMTTQDPSTPLHHTPIKRRGFVKWMVGGIAGLWTMMAAYPVFRYLKSGATEAPQQAVSSVNVGSVKELPVNAGKNFKFGSTPALVVHGEDGEFHAYKAVCTHLGCTVQYNPEKSRIWCACHGGQYDAATGQNIAGPPPKPLEALKVDVHDDQITVSKA